MQVLGGFIMQWEQERFQGKWAGIFAPNGSCPPGILGLHFDVDISPLCYLALGHGLSS